jgi:hypothetical protein
MSARRSRRHTGQLQRRIGALRGNRNAFRHGRYSAEAIAQRRMVAALIRACRDQLGTMCDV